MTKRVTAVFGGLALMFLLGPAAAVDQSIAALPLEKKMQLAKAGDIEAKLAVGEAYELGENVKANGAEAAKWYREAALGGNLDAQFHLAKLVGKGAPGLKVDKATAIALLSNAAKKGHAPSQNLYGLMLQNGDGLAKDEKAAVEWYRKAADQGLAVAENNLGVMLVQGRGADRSLDEAFKLFTRAAAGKDGWAFNNLGGMYEMGWGTPKDLEKAKQNYQHAADLGIDIAKKNLSRLGTAQPASAAAAPTASGVKSP